MGLAVTAGLIGCSAHQSGNGGVSASAAAQAQSVGARLAEQDRENTERHRKALARLMRIDHVVVNEADRTMTLRFVAHNLSAKTVRRIEAGFEVDGDHNARIAGTEFHEPISIAPHGATPFTLAIPYTAFGSGTGPMRESLGKPQHYVLDVNEIKYADGSDAGYDD